MLGYCGTGPFNTSWLLFVCYCCSGAVGTIQDMATGMDAAGTGGSSGASSRAMSRWRLMACHTSPDFRDATPKDKITLGGLQCFFLAVGAV